LADALARIRPFVLSANDEGRALVTFARELAAMAALADKARVLDPSGGFESELDRLLAQAAELGLKGAGPRAWLAELLAHLEDGRPAGKPTDDAINLLTSHSAKGLEWPVVLVLGLWRGIGRPPESGLRLIRDDRLGAQVYFDKASLPPTVQESRDRERVRELGRLLYVTLTRARRGLVMPWADGFGGTQYETPCFADLWGVDLATIDELSGESRAAQEAKAAPLHRAEVPARQPTGRALASLPARLLPHQLARSPDAARQARHESGEDEPLAMGGLDDPITYGLWWHETMESLPWTSDDAAVEAYGRQALREAEARGCRVRAEDEWTRLRTSASWPLLRSARWSREAEIGIFAPLRSGAWIDGVVDLVLHDETSGEVWVLDWKTNRRRQGESDAALLARLAAEYAPQLSAYGECIAAFFPGCRVRRSVFSSVVGAPRDTDLEKF
jgi:ATP-dependent exoDNAse (exonuclease V) beta subunit